jgi:hypothetical protein
MRVRVTGKIRNDKGDSISLTQDYNLPSDYLPVRFWISKEERQTLRERMFDKFLGLIPDLGREGNNKTLRGSTLPSLSTLTCRYKVLAK